MLFVFALFFISCYAQRSDCSIVIEAYKLMGGFTVLDPFSSDINSCCYDPETEEGIDGVSCEEEKVTVILWDDEALDGSIPSILGQLSNLLVLRLDKNHLSGNIPYSLGLLRNLKFLFLNDNNLSGTIPSSFQNLINVSRISLANNDIFGRLPDLIALTSLKWFDLRGTHVSREIPVEKENIIHF